jgi:hypothetical protein
MLRSSVHAWVVVLAAVAGCRDGGKDETGPIPAEEAPGAFGEALCNLQFEQCDCTRVQELVGSIEFCANAYATQLAMYFAEAQAAGLEYHPECMGEYIDFYTQSIGCSTRSELTGELLTKVQVPPCKVHSGSAVVGETCTPYYQAMGDSCAQGLQCLGGTCMAIVAPVRRTEGQQCNPQTDLCEEGMLCTLTEANPTGPTSCVRGPKAGEPCSGYCDVGLRCDIPTDGTDRVCLPPPGEGEPCAFPPYECAAGLRCDGSTCTVGLPEGAECSGDDSCAVGLECGEVDGGPDACQPEQAFVCI